MATAGWRLIESFSDSARRSYRAAVSLKASGDVITAGHMFGVAAECAVKAALERAGIVVDRQSGFRTHFPALRGAILRSGRTRHMRQLLSTLTPMPPVLQHYVIDTRYAANLNISALMCSQWHSDTTKIMQACGISA